MGNIMTDSDGNVFESFDAIDEVEANGLQGLTHCLAVVRVNGDYLLGRNRFRNRYEIFGGCMESGETARESITRECREELGAEGDFEYLGVMKFLMMPDYFSDKKRTEFGCLYGITLENRPLDDLYSQIKDRREILRLALYEDIKGREPISEIDELLLRYYK